jgi:hypothetical protein
MSLQVAFVFRIALFTTLLAFLAQKNVQQKGYAEILRKPSRAKLP